MALEGTFEVGTPSQTNGGKKEYASRPSLREFTYTAEYWGCEQIKDVKYEDRHKPDSEQEKVDKISFKFRVLLPKADAALEKIETLEGSAREKALADYEEKYLNKGHGRWAWCNVNVPPFIGPPAPNGKESKLYASLCALLNDGKPLSLAEIKGFKTKVNALENKNDDGTDIVPPAEFVRPQVHIYIKQTKTGRNYVSQIIGIVPEEDRLPAFRYLERPADPRTANDDPDLNCEDCGNHISGYERRMGEHAGSWVSNTEAAQHANEKYGKTLCGKCISQVKQQRAVAGGMPF